MQDPDDASVVRLRAAFEDKHKTVRVCTPWVAKKRSVGTSDHPHVSFGPALGSVRIAAEWQIAKILKEKGRFEDMDLANLPSFARSGGAETRIGQDESGRWFLSQWLGHAVGKWGNIADQWALENGVDLAEIRAIADALYSPGGFMPKAWDDLRKTTLWIPIDMRLSVEDQMEAQKGGLKRIQSYLLRLSGRKGAMRSPDPDVLFRDVYCYLLSTRGKKTAAAIGAEVFPEEKGPRRAAKVRKILSIVRRDLTARKGGQGAK